MNYADRTFGNYQMKDMIKINSKKILGCLLKTENILNERVYIRNSATGY